MSTMTIGLTLDAARNHIGDTVIWYPPTPFDGAKSDGVIVRVDATYVYVRYSYDGSIQPTHPGNLKLLT